MEKLVLLLFIFSSFLGCLKNEALDSKKSSEHDIGLSVDRLKARGYRVYLSELQRQGQGTQDEHLQYALNLTQTPKSVIQSLDYIAELLPPSLNDLKLQATGAKAYKNKILVVYNTAGSSVQGGIDILDVDDMSLNLVNSYLFDQYEFSKVVEFNDYIILGGQKLLEDGSTHANIVIGKIEGDSLILINEMSFSGFYVTSMFVDDDTLYVASGDNGKLYKVDEDFEVLEEVEIPNLLDVSFYNGSVWSLGGSSNLTLYRFDPDFIPLDSKILENEKCDAPTRFDIWQNFFFINSCHQKLFRGTEMADLDYDQGIIGRPNGVKVSDQFILMALGHAGLCSYKNDSGAVGDLMGCFDFLDDSGSANSVNHLTLADGRELIVLTDGLGGTRILKEVEIVDIDNSLASFVGYDVSFDNEKKDLFGEVILSSGSGGLSRLFINENLYFEQLSADALPFYENGYLYFDGDDDSFVSSERMLNDSGSYSMAFALKANTLPSSDSVIVGSTDDKGFSVILSPNGQISLLHDQKKFLGSDVNIKAGEDYFVEISYNDEGKSYLSINGRNVATSTTVEDYIAEDFVLGASRGFSSFDGVLKRLRVFNGIYSVSDIINTRTWANDNLILNDPYGEVIVGSLDGDLVLWLDSTDLNTIKDKNGNSASSNNFSGNVATWVDKTASAHNLIQLNDSKMPKVKNEGGIEFDGKSFLEVFTENIMGTGEYTKVIVVKFDVLNKKNNMISSGVGENHAFYMGDTAYPQLWHNHYRFNFSTVPVTVNKTTLLHSSYGNSNVENKIYIDGILGGSSVDVRAFDDPKIEIGSHGGGYGLHGIIYEVRIYNKSLNNEERASVENELMLKYGIE